MTGAAVATSSKVKWHTNGGLRREQFPPKKNERTAAVLIRLSDHALVDDLCDHYRRSGFAVEPVCQGMVDATLADAPDDAQARRELLMHLRVWRVLNPNVVAQTVG